MEVSPGGAQERAALLPAFVCAALCVFLIRSGFLMFLFLSPLCAAFYGYNRRTAILAMLLAVTGNGVITLAVMIAAHASGDQVLRREALRSLLLFAAMTFSFTWALSGPKKTTGNPDFYRLLGGAVFSCLVFFIMFFKGFDDPRLEEQFKAQAELLSQIYQSPSADAVQTEMLSAIEPEHILEIIKTVLLRGGALAFGVFLFVVCRQIGCFLARLVRHVRVGRHLLNFHVSPRMIWVTSFSLLFILITRGVKLEGPEIVLWNVLVLCCILYLAQGMGILQFFLGRSSTPPFFRVALSAVLVVLILSPGINAVILALITLLGIAENWVSLRPPPTPEA